MIKIDAGDFFLVEPCEEYAEQIAEYRCAETGQFDKTNELSLFKSFLLYYFINFILS